MAKIRTSKALKSGTLAAVQAAQVEDDKMGVRLANQKAKLAKLSREVDALHAEHIPFEEAISSCEDEEGPKQPPGQAAKAREQAPQAPQAPLSSAHRDTRLAVAGQPSSKRRCTKGDGKGATATGMSEDDDSGNDTP